MYKSKEPEYQKEYFKKHRQKPEVKLRHREECKKHYEKNKSLKIEKVRKYSKKNPEKLIEKQRNRREKFPERGKAEYLAHKNIKILKGTLCEKCKKELATERHHEDYSKPLEVKLLCKKCHFKRHREINKQILLLKIRGSEQNKSSEGSNTVEQTEMTGSVSEVNNLGCGEWIENWYDDGDHQHKDIIECGTIDYYGKPFLCKDCQSKQEKRIVISKHIIIPKHITKMEALNKNKEEIEKIDNGCGYIEEPEKQLSRICSELWLCPTCRDKRQERIKTSILWCEAIEDKLDKLNGEKGNLCLYCDAKEYDGKVGIIHKDNCLILQLRTHLNWLKEQEKE